ncbi:MAG: sugar phosphate isomerase/epimerase [Chloroflexota bacterium]|nr:sugar phosphate isomerase/epimerase [Chloroflexota bacterium]
MRFGITQMQFEGLINSSMAPEAMLAYVAGYDPVEGARELAAQGFDPIELGADLSLFFPRAFAPEAVERLGSLRREQGLRYTVHLPMWSVEPSSPVAPVRLGSVRAVVDAIKATAPLEPEVYVLHAMGALAAEFARRRLPEVPYTLLMRIFQEQARQSLETILAETGLPSRRLAIETIEFPFELVLELAEELDVSICLDVGHVLAGFAGPIGLFDALDACLPRLGEIHLHDAPWQGEGTGRRLRHGEDHRPLGSGDLDVTRLLDRLTEGNFTGPVVFELSVQEALRSLELIRSLRPEVLPTSRGNADVRAAS